MQEPHDNPADDGPMMPQGPRETASVVQSGGPTPAPVQLESPPSFGRMAAQLVVIPAVIVIAVLIVVAIFGSLAATPDNIHEQLATLRQSGGYGNKLPLGAQDPRYKDACQAAYQIALMIPKLESDKERLEVSNELVKILAEKVHREEHELTRYLVNAIGMLAQPGGFEAILKQADSPHWEVRHAVLVALDTWAIQDLQTARGAVDTVAKLLTDPYDEVRGTAAALCWTIATPQDTQVIAPLREAMSSIGLDPTQRTYQFAINQSAITLAALGDAEGSRFVAEVLLNRSALAKMRANPRENAGLMLDENDQSRFMAATLVLVSKMTDERIWAKVRELSEKDPNLTIRKAALQVIDDRK